MKNDRNKNNPFGAPHTNKRYQRKEEKKWKKINAEIYIICFLRFEKVLFFKPPPALPVDVFWFPNP